MSTIDCCPPSERRLSTEVRRSAAISSPRPWKDQCGRDAQGASTGMECAPPLEHAAGFSCGSLWRHGHEPPVGRHDHEDRVGPICEQDYGSKHPAPVEGTQLVLNAGRKVGGREVDYDGLVGPVLFGRDREFESPSLQRRVRLSPASAFEAREPRPSARVCAAGLAPGRQRRSACFDSAPTCGNISAGPYSSTAVPVTVVGENTMPAPTKSGLLRA